MEHETDFEQDLKQLDDTQPHWDEPLRVQGALRRLRVDASPEGMAVVTAIFGEATMHEAYRLYQTKQPFNP